MSPPAGGPRSVVVPFIVFTVIWGSTWIVIRDQLGPGGEGVPAQWSVAYRFILAAAAMFAVAKWNGDRLVPAASGSARAQQQSGGDRQRQQRTGRA